jgi:ribose transport system substrate-binding protein
MASATDDLTVGAVRRRKFLLVSAALAALLLVDGLVLVAHYTRRNGTSPPSQTRPTSSPRERLLIELIANGRPDSYDCSILAGARSAAKTEGVDLVVHDSGPPTWIQQATLLSSAIIERANAVVLEPVDYEPLTGMVRAAHDQETPVVLVDVSPDANPGLAWAFAYSDDGALGRLAATELAKVAGSGGETLLIESPTARAAPTGPFANSLHLVLAGKNRQLDVSTIETFLRSHPRISGIFAADDSVALSVVEGASGAGRHVPIVAGDAEPDELRLLRAGEISALIAEPGWQLGRAALDAAIAGAFSRRVGNQVIQPVLLTPASFTGLRPTAVPAGFEADTIDPGCRT